MKIRAAVVAAVVALVVVLGIVKLLTPSAYDQCVSDGVAQYKTYTRTGTDSLPPVCLKLTHAQQVKAANQITQKIEQEIDQRYGVG